MTETQLKRLLRYGVWWSQPEVRGEHSPSRLIEDGIRKAVFLDIDGVLNDDGYNTEDGVVIDPAFVDNLRKIIDATGAEVILSSSWRYGYYSYARFGFPGDDKNLEMLFAELDKRDIKIAGGTPFMGNEGRPKEICTWLKMRKDIKSFVILDDDQWEWDELEPNFVRTSREDENGKYGLHCGLEEEHVQQAIQILNQFD